MSIFSRSKPSRVPEPSPLDGFEDARKTWFEKFGHVTVTRSRSNAVNALLVACIIALAIAISTMLPLKTVQPYIVKVDESGFVAVDAAAAQQYKPGNREKQYFLAEWTRKFYTLDKALTERYLTEAYAFTTGTATNQFKEFINTDRPLVQLSENQFLKRDVIIHSISFVDEEVALVRFTNETWTTSGVQRKKLLLTIRFNIVPPTTDEEILKNPIGIRIVHFNVNEDLAK